MKKAVWEVTVVESLGPELKRKIRRILKPYLNVSQRYGNCELCGGETSWLLNNHLVCPLCSVKYDFVKETFLPDACEVCGYQGEWVCGAQGEHSLCHRHRDAWGKWKKRDVLLEGYHKLPPAERGFLWDQCFNTFVEEMKAEAGVK